MIWLRYPMTWYRLEPLLINRQHSHQVQLLLTNEPSLNIYDLETLEVTLYRFNYPSKQPIP